MKRIISLYCVILVFSVATTTAQQRIITLNSALSETVHALGKSQNIVAVDVTSEYPRDIKNKPRVAKDRTVSLEGLLAFRPDLILTPPNTINQDIESKLKKLGVRVVTVAQEYSARGAARFIKEVAQYVGKPNEGVALVNTLNAELEVVLRDAQPKTRKKVLFIYARGVGLMSVAGKGSSLDAIITLSGGRNAVQEFTDFRSYSTEALIKANPDALLLFDFGTSSLGGKEAILNMPGVSMTKAGKTKQVLSMDGALLVNFSTRLPQAIRELHRLLYAN